jgi:hypothetical protein
MKLTKKCDICDDRKIHICMEKMCQSTSLIFLNYEQFNHRYHRLNELQMAVIDKKVIPCRNNQTIKLIRKIISELTKKLERAKVIVKEANKMVYYLLGIRK